MIKNLPLDPDMLREGICEIAIVDENNEIVIHTADSKKFNLKVERIETPEQIGTLIENRLNKVMGEKVSQHIIEFICRPENWAILFPPSASAETEETTEPMHNVTGKVLQQQKKKETYVQRFSNARYCAEAILVNDIPKFLLVDTEKSQEIEIVVQISFADEIIRPLKTLSYINRPYCFSTDTDVNSFIEKARTETLDSLYRKVKSLWKRYVAADDFHISICAADTIFTYYQIAAGMTHYLFFVGGPGSGKSNNLEMFHLLAYRNMTSTGITAPNIYAYYGGREEGLGTICEDEADDLDQNKDKMKFYKNGYTKNHPVFRQDDTAGESGRTPRRYFTFGWKAFAAERLPDSVIAMGLLERGIILECVFGIPDYDITEVISPMGDNNFQELLNEFEEIRNLLFVHRLLNHNKKFPDIKLNIRGREKQLFKPILRIFQGTETQQELLFVISNFLNNKRADKIDSLHAYLFGVIKALIKKTGSYQLTSKQIWDKVTGPSGLEGEWMYGGMTSFMSVRFNKITQKKIGDTCRQIFGAKPSSDTKHRGHVFDRRKLQRLEYFYNASLRVKVAEVTDVADYGSMSGGLGMEKYTENPDFNSETEHNTDENGG